jgi:hypothetical protein
MRLVPVLRKYFKLEVPGASKIKSLTKCETFLKLFLQNLLILQMLAQTISNASP